MVHSNQFDVAETQSPHWEPENILGGLTLGRLLFSNDYRMIAIKGVLFSLIVLAIGGLFGLTFRLELTLPGIQFLEARAYMGLMSFHGVAMVLAFLIPLLFSVCYYMMPKLLNLDRLHWAILANLSFWLLLLAAVLLVLARPDFTWTVYAPMSLRVGGNLVWMGYVAVFLVGVSEFLAGFVFVRNALAWRGGMMNMSLMGWAMLALGVTLLISTPALALTGLFLLTDWTGVTALFDPARGGDVKNFLWLFWFYGHPAVYLPFIPAIALIYTFLPRFLGRPVWSYKSGVVAFVLITVLGVMVFHHHYQPDVTVHTWVQRFFQFGTLLIFIPSTLHVFNWIASLWEGRIPDSARRAIPFKFMIAAIFMVMYGGVTAFINAQIAVDTDFIHNTYWIPAHFHAMFLGFSGQLAIAGVYYLWPYITARRFNQRLADWHFWLWQIGIFGKLTMMFILGWNYFPRWVVDYLPRSDWTIPQIGLTFFGFLIGLGFVLMVANLAMSARRAAPEIDGDPWELEDSPQPVAAAAPAE
jgi:cytochrome c oxidase subunit 1